MKMIDLAVMAATSLLAAQCTAGTVRLKGKIDLKRQHVEMAWDGASSMLGGGPRFMLQTDTQGNFDTILPIKTPGYYTIERNTLYLTPGDELTLFITDDSFKARFAGLGNGANNYLAGRPFPKGGSFLMAGANIREDLRSTKAAVDSLAALRFGQLAELENISPEFLDMETARIKADIANSYASSLTQFGYFRGETMTQEDFDKLVEEYERDFIPLVRQLSSEVTAEKYLDVAAVRSLLQMKTLDTMAPVFEGIELPARTAELFRAYKLSLELTDNADPQAFEQAKAFVAAMDQPDFRKEMERIIAGSGTLAAGKPAPDMRLANAQGEASPLSDLKGRVLYIDLWATWCAPCLQESPAFDALAKKFAGDKRIAFVKISTDTNLTAWKNAIAGKTHDSLQFICNDKSLGKAWKLTGIPRFILIGRDFRIIDAFAPRPSSEGMEETLRKILAGQAD